MRRYVEAQTRRLLRFLLLRFRPLSTGTDEPALLPAGVTHSRS
jgi:hypothetical protein